MPFYKYQSHSNLSKSWAGNLNICCGISEFVLLLATKIVTEKEAASSVLLLFDWKRDKSRCTNLFGSMFHTIWFTAAEGHKFSKFNIYHYVLYAGAAGGQIHLIKSNTPFERPVQQNVIVWQYVCDYCWELKIHELIRLPVTVSCCISNIKRWG